MSTLNAPRIKNKKGLIITNTITNQIFYVVNVSDFGLANNCPKLFTKISMLIKGTRKSANNFIARLSTDIEENTFRPILVESSKTWISIDKI